jgi:hypothetical protein
MNKEEMTATILAYSVELRDEYIEIIQGIFAFAILWVGMYFACYL